MTIRRPISDLRAKMSRRGGLYILYIDIINNIFSLRLAQYAAQEGGGGHGGGRGGRSRREGWPRALAQVNITFTELNY